MRVAQIAVQPGAEQAIEDGCARKYEHPNQYCGRETHHQDHGDDEEPSFSLAVLGQRRPCDPERESGSHAETRKAHPRDKGGDGDENGKAAGVEGPDGYRHSHGYPRKEPSQTLLSWRMCRFAHRGMRSVGLFA